MVQPIDQSLMFVSDDTVETTSSPFDNWFYPSSTLPYYDSYERYQRNPLFGLYGGPLEWTDTWFDNTSVLDPSAQMFPDQYRSGIPATFHTVQNIADEVARPYKPYYDQLQYDAFLDYYNQLKKDWERSGETEMVQERMADRAPGFLAGQIYDAPIPEKDQVRPKYHYSDHYNNPYHTDWNYQYLPVGIYDKMNYGQQFQTMPFGTSEFDTDYLLQNPEKISQRINYNLPLPHTSNEYYGMPFATTEILTERPIPTSNPYSSYPDATMPTPIYPTQEENLGYAF